MKTINKMAILSSLVLATGLMSCKKDDGDSIGTKPGTTSPVNAIVVNPSDGSHKTAKMNVKMVDAPSAYAFQQVNVDIQSMAGLITTDDGQSTWVDFGANAGVYNAITLINGNSALIGDGDIYAGHLTQVFVQLGSNNSVMIDGQSQQIDFSGNGTGGVYINVDQTIDENEDFTLMLDFDVASSIVAQSNGNGNGGLVFSLNPTIDIFTSEQTSEMTGQISFLLGLSHNVLIVADNGNGDVHATYADAVTGSFMLQGLEGGEYDVNAYFANGLSFSLGDNVQIGANVNINLGLLLQGIH